MSSSPDKLLLNESRTSPSAAGLVGTIEGHLLINGAVILLSLFQLEQIASSA